jgi:hypothetical protein
MRAKAAYDYQFGQPEFDEGILWAGLGVRRRVLRCSLVVRPRRGRRRSDPASVLRLLSLGQVRAEPSNAIAAIVSGMSNPAIARCLPMSANRAND